MCGVHLHCDEGPHPCLACACEVLKVSGLDGQPTCIPAGLKKADKPEQIAFINDVSQAVVEKCTLLDAAFTTITEPSTATNTSEEEDGVYNYARVFCHFAALLMEFRDAWGTGDGERVLRCWKLFMPHFKAAGHTKYALQALRLQMQVNVTLSPNLAHQVMWNRFVNVRGGIGRNIPCDLYNEHVNKLLKHIIRNMGPNLTEKALQRAARSVTMLDTIAASFDVQSGVPHRTSAHSTKSDIQDVKKVMMTVMKHKLLTQVGYREHRTFPGMALNPLAKWDVKKTQLWITEKKKEYMKYKGKFRADIMQ